jgi:hypothetical protein
MARTATPARYGARNQIATSPGMPGEAHEGHAPASHVAPRVGSRPPARPSRFPLRSRDPGAPDEPPTDLDVRSERMVRSKASHDSRVSEKRAVGLFNRPTRNPMLDVRCSIAVEFLVASDLIDRTTLVGHYFGIGMHLSKRRTVFVTPGVKPQSLRLDH